MANQTGTRPASAVPLSEYQPKKFDNNKYQVNSYQYPEDLTGNSKSYGSNYVIFYINVNEDSKMLKNTDINDYTNKNVLTTKIPDNERVKKQLLGKAYSTEKIVAAQIATGTLAGTAIGAAIGSGGIGGVAGAALGAAGTASVATNASSFSRAQKRLTSAIALYVPNQLSIRYGVGWSDEETFGLQAIIDGGEAAGRAIAAAGSALMSKDAATAASAIGTELKGTSALVGSLAIQRGPNGAALSALTGVAPNPMKEQVFKNVDFRTFTMEYNFAPRDSSEAKNVLNIIQAFKYHMHPELKDAKNFLYIYPSEFDIVYYHGGEENMNIHRHTSCVLTELNINYSPNGIFNTFSDGMPTQINITMSFKELTVLTKELIAQGL
jgi:hypothetical protein